MIKSEIRKKYLHKRENLSQGEVTNLSEKIFKNFTISDGVQLIMDQDATIECGRDAVRFTIAGNQSNRVVIKGENAAPAYWGGVLLSGKSDFYKFSYLTNESLIRIIDFNDHWQYCNIVCLNKNSDYVPF